LETNLQTKLTTLDDTVQTLVTRLDSLDTCIDTKFASMETTLIAVISEKLAASNLVTKVSAVMGGEASPFVTAASIDLKLTAWFTKVTQRLDGIVTSVTDNEQPCPH
jgi:hypothetical protein